MSKFDENLFGRIAVLSHYLTQEQLQDCLDWQRTQSSRVHIGHILLERGFLTNDQFDRILEIRRKKIRKLLTDRDEARESEREFSNLALRDGAIDLEQLEAAVLEQQHMRRLNLRFTLAEVLVSRGDLTREDAWRIQARQGRRVLGCPVCDSHYRIVDFRDGCEYSCPRCEHEALVPPPFLDSMLVDAELESSGGDSDRATREAVEVARGA